MRSRALRRWSVIAVASIVLLVGLFLLWKQGSPYQARFYSPNHRYYVQKYQNPLPSQFLATMPGQGSDAVGGYIRLFDAEGRLVHERFARFIRDVQPVWAGREVYLMGIAEMDQDPWQLPASSE